MPIRECTLISSVSDAAAFFFLSVTVAAFVFGQLARFLSAPGQLSGSASSSTIGEFIAQRGKACFVILMHKKAP
jgi:hypothetical protein